MRQLTLILFCIFIFQAHGQKKGNVVKPAYSNELVVHGSKTSFWGLFSYPNILINDHFAIYQLKDSLIVFYPDFATLKLPEDIYEDDYAFSFDKNGIYFEGNLITSDTSEFHILGASDTGVFWKNSSKVYLNDQILPRADAETFKNAYYFNDRYQIDKNGVYYNGKFIESSDTSSFSGLERDIFSFGNEVFLNGKFAYYNDEKISAINKSLFKTNSKVLTICKYFGRPFWEETTLDPQTVRALSDSYALDKNGIYYESSPTPFPARDSAKIKIWDQVNSNYISDGKRVFQLDTFELKSVDAASFGMIPNSDDYFDRSGIYTGYRNDQSPFKFPFRYSKTPNFSNTGIAKDYAYIIYLDQVYDLREDKLTSGYSKEEIIKIKNGDLLPGQAIEKAGSIEKQFGDGFYLKNNKIYFAEDPIQADVASFELINGRTFKDKDHVWAMNEDDEFVILDEIDATSVKEFNGFIRDKNFIYLDNQQLISSANIQLLAIFTGYRPGCGMDETPSSDYYLFHNDEGYYLVLRWAGQASIRRLGKTIPTGVLPEEFILPVIK